MSPHVFRSPSRRLFRLVIAGAIAALAGGALPTGYADASLAAVATPAQLVGQKLVVAMSGTTPSDAILGRIARGEVGGVILFGSNITTAAALRALTDRLQAAAAAGAQPPLLIATDQEGGSVRRIPWAPPTLSPLQMGSLGSATTAGSQGAATGTVLRCAGINTNLAPVADVPSATSSFMYQQGRTWSFSATVTGSLSTAFATGLRSGGTVPAMKHFPGIGLATLDTDSNVVTISASQATLAPGLQPYQRAIANGIPLIMLSNATYPTYDAVNAAGWSHAIGVDLLRTTLGFQGVTITDSLTGTASARGVTATSLAVRAAQAGTDLILLTGSESSTAATYATLVADATNGAIPASTLAASYERILTLKGTLAAATPDATGPVVGVPNSRLYAGSTLGTTTTPVRTSWSATDPCGISGSTLERRVNGGAWVVQPLAAPSTMSVTQSLVTGSVDRYVVKATDGAGNISGWRYGSFFEPLVTQQTSSAVAWRRTWTTVTSSRYSGGSTRYATAAGASASFTFAGSSVAWVSAIGPSRGSAEVYLDGVYRATVSLHAATAASRRIVYAASWASQGTHTIRIVVVGTAGHSRVDVDAFVRLVRL
jgi:beta-N-acetylhexosaminidase